MSRQDISVGYKKCCDCHEVKLTKDFNKDRNNKDGLQYICRSCSSKRGKKHRSDLKKNGLCISCGKRKPRLDRVTCSVCSEGFIKYDHSYKTRKTERGECFQCCKPSAEGHKLCETCLANARERAKQKTLEFCKKVSNYFDNTCQICGLHSEETEIFAAHHIDPTLKEYDVSKMVSKDWEIVVIPELEKTAYLCLICHARLHARRFDEDLASGELILIPGKVESSQRLKAVGE